MQDEALRRLLSLVFKYDLEAIFSRGHRRNMVLEAVGHLNTLNIDEMELMVC